MRTNNIRLRRLKNNDNDYKKLEEWYQIKEIYLNFEQRKLSYDEIKKKYFPRTLKNSKVPVYMIEYDNKPVGIIQYQLINNENMEIYKIDNNDNNYEIDIFIGELKYHNKGIGKISIDLLCDYLLSKKNANYLVMCPLKSNSNAIRCYEKCRFKIIREFSTEDTIGKIQTFLLMIKEK